MTRPLVSVIVPVYNHARYVEAALLSVIRQTWRPIELIVIDDGSQDESADIASALLRYEMPDAVVLRRENRGAHNTINQGLGMSTGEYLAILNSDDSFHPSRIERCVETALRARRDFVFTGVSFMDGEGETVESNDFIEAIRRVETLSERYPTIGYALMKNQVAVSSGNFFFSRRLYEQLGGFRHYRYVHDWDFILRALFYTEPYFIREPMYNYRLHETNSFRSLGSVEGNETSEVMRNFLWLMTARLPENPLAPCPHYWPGYFDWFIRTWSYQVYMPSRLRAA